MSLILLQRYGAATARTSVRDPICAPRGVGYPTQTRSRGMMVTSLTEALRLREPNKRALEGAGVPEVTEGAGQATSPGN